MKRLVQLLFFLLVGLVTPGQACDAEPNPWEVLDGMLRKGKPSPGVPASLLNGRYEGLSMLACGAAHSAAVNKWLNTSQDVIPVKAGFKTLPPISIETIG